MADNHHKSYTSLTVDCVLFGYEVAKTLQVLLIERKYEPYAGCWALPGGFVNEDENLDQAALRELQEETGVSNVFIEQLYSFGEPNRDPRGRVVTVAYFGLINLQQHPIAPASDAKEVQWFALDQLPKLAFDHQQILEVAVNRLRAKVRYQPIGFELLPEQFTLSQLQDLYEAILGLKNELNKRNFRTRFLKMGVLREVGRQQMVSHRPAMLYEFDKEKYTQLARERYEELLRRGVDFEI